MRHGRQAREAIPKLEPGQIVECRGGTWRFLREEKGFWELELIKQGTHFTEELVRIWALPALEQDSLKVYDRNTSLAPKPTDEQRQKDKIYKPYLAARRSLSVQDHHSSKEPSTALHCAIDHKAWQFEPWNRIVDHLPFPRLLIADDVGLGKTTEAAIILAELTRRRRADRVLIIAPQHLSEKWQGELYDRFGLAFEIYDRETRLRMTERGVRNPWEVVERVIVSRDFVKRWENLKSLESVNWDLIIIDECHHFVRDRHEAPNRLRELAERIVYKSPGLIMLSATPFTGSKDEFHSLLRLIDPKFSNPKAAEQWQADNPYLIRRLKGDVEKQGEKIQKRKIHEVMVTEDSLSKDEKKILDAIHMTLMERRSSAKAETWDRLLEETARKRLSSSWSAFHESISGSKRLTEWFTESVRKSLAQLVANHDSGKLRALDQTLKSIWTEEPTAKVVVFTEAIKSQEFIQSYFTDRVKLKPEAVASIKGDTPHEERLRIEDDFSNRDSPLRLLIATDTISEGKDLQHACHHLIHFELPWSLVTIEQRNGRIDRLGQNQVPHIHNLVFDTKATPDQRVLDRLTQRLTAAAHSLGSVSPIISGFDKMDLLEVADEKVLEKQLKDAESESQKFFSFNAPSAFSAAPLSAPEDHNERRQNFSLMLEVLEGKIEAQGKIQHEWRLSLPEGWDISGLDLLAEDYPSFDAPWRITFDPKTFLQYESHRLSSGRGERILHFISPIHPIAVQVESRFRSHVVQKGYPVFAVKEAPFAQMVLAELSARAPSGRILSQRLVVFETHGLKPIPITALGEFKAINGPQSLPGEQAWRKVENHLEELSRGFAGDLARDFAARLKEWSKEQKAIPEDTPGCKERGAWLQELWSVDVDYGQYQVQALLLRG